MSSIKCRRCGLTNWADQEVCKRCKSPIAARNGSGEGEQIQSSAEHFPVQPAPTPVAPLDFQPTHTRPNFQQPAWVSAAPAPDQKMGLAIASMVLGIVAFVTVLVLIGVLFAPVGLVLGIVALVKAKRYPAQFGGKGFAIAGVVLSSLVMLWVPIVAAIAIPNLMAARRAANEGMAVSMMRKLIVAQSRYSSQSANAGCGDLITLNQMDYIDGQLSTGEKSGYKYVIENLPGGGCEMHATPLTSSSGERSFFVSSNDGLIHVAKRNGQRASGRDDVIGQERRDD